MAIPSRGVPVYLPAFANIVGVDNAELENAGLESRGPNNNNEAAASRKEVKYSDLPASFSFQPIAVETLGPINESAVDLSLIHI